jgi:hypothetical protein
VRMNDETFSTHSNRIGEFARMTATGHATDVCRIGDVRPRVPGGHFIARRS